jgi:hypothetical protein
MTAAWVACWLLQQQADEAELERKAKAEEEAKRKAHAEEEARARTCAGLYGVPTSCIFTPRPEQTWTTGAANFTSAPPSHFTPTVTRRPTSYEVRIDASAATSYWSIYLDGNRVTDGYARTERKARKAALKAIKRDQHYRNVPTWRVIINTRPR